MQQCVQCGRVWYSDLFVAKCTVCECDSDLYVAMWKSDSDQYVAMCTV